MHGTGMTIVAACALALAATLPRLAEGRPDAHEPAGVDMIDVQSSSVPTDPSPVDVEVDDLALLATEWQPFDRSFLPASALELDRRRVRIRGWMFPPYQERGIKVFMLTGETQGPSFNWRVGNTFKISHFSISVRLRDGITTKYISGHPILVEGRFRIEAVTDDDGYLMWLYSIDDATIEPVKPRPGYENSIVMGC
ncbi:MAG: hypothetical protein WD066_18155 [Planctomycetaceae bacterium]